MNTRNLLTWALVCLALAGTSHPGYAASASFAPAKNYAVGTNPLGVAAGDFNGDGHMDLAVANSGDPNANDDGGISILLGNGDGTFQPANNLTVGKNPRALAAADFNGDGRDDLVLLDSLGTAVSLSNGNGTFRPVTYIPTANGPLALVVADLNGDNIPDLAVAASSLSVLLGNGDGTFQSHVDYTTPGGMGVIISGDVNGDGKRDIVERGLGIKIFLGNGDGSLQSPISSTDSSFGGFLVMADFNLDGKPDLAEEFLDISTNQFEVAVMLGNGDGTFQPWTPTNLSFSHPTAMSARDLDGDGKADLVIVTDSANVFLGNGDGTFQSGLSFGVGGGSHSVVAADFNQDKAPDLVVANSTDNTISVLLNTTGADFSITASTPNPATVSRGQSSTSTVTLGHLNSFETPVELTCSVQPAQAAPTCSLDQNSITFDASGNATATLTMHTGATASLLLGSPLDSRPIQFAWLPMAGFALMGAGFGSSRSSRRKLTSYLLGCILFGGLILQAACGGGSVTVHPTPSTAYTITVTGTSGSTQHSTTTTLTVQ